MRGGWRARAYVVDDYVVDEDMNKIIVEESAKESSKVIETGEEAEDFNSNNVMGSISFVSCATGDESIATESIASSEEGEDCHVIEGCFKKL